jgi:hypothetical protein
MAVNMRSGKLNGVAELHKRKKTSLLGATTFPQRFPNI